MGLFDVINFAAEKAYKKYKGSKMESAMDALLSALETNSVNIEVLPYKEGEDYHVIKGRVYRLKNEEMGSSTAPYFLTTSDWLVKGGVDINNDNIYHSSFLEKGAYTSIKLREKYLNLAKNYSAKYGSNSVLTSLFVYLPESKFLMAMPRYIRDKHGTVLIANKVAHEDFNAFEKMRAEHPENMVNNLHNFYYRAKFFAYLVANELNQYDKTNLDNAFSKFEEKHGHGAEISYTY
ncbi:MAG: hypothetical protein M1284_02250 [Candidatus Parvarchaeota archaeon]|jgi:hypothetical protein|nr:hypothetical protein [Candidatus Parvarchaeota archaeon]MCL5420555.1 hypothetical protein [Candidatus Parvarchaeota archaeon]